MVTLLCAAAKPVESVRAKNAPASLAIVFFIGFLHSAAGTIMQRDWLEKRAAGRWSAAFRRNSMRGQRQPWGGPTMNRIAVAVSIAAAFAAGCGATYLLGPALAAESIPAQIIHTGEMEGDALGSANKVGYRAKMFASADGATISIQGGNVPKHKHPNTNEIQSILA